MDSLHPKDPIDYVAVRRYRLARVQDQLRKRDLAAAVLFDPHNLRYATGSRNMAVWTLHNHVRYAFVPAEGLPVLFEFGAGKWPVASQSLENPAEIRPPRSWTHFYSGSEKQAHAAAWAAELADLASASGGGKRRIAFDHLNPIGLRAIEALGFEVADGEALMEHARLIKSAEEIARIRRAVAVAEEGMRRMRETLRPGVTENALWAILNQTNAEMDGEWLETRLLSSGPRTNPWMQEASFRTVEAGDLVAFDTDMIGPNGYCADISRTYFCGPGRPSDEQKRLYAASHAQIEHNLALMNPGRTLREVIENESHFPEAYLPYRYGFAHGVGLKDEFPFLRNAADLDQQNDPEMRLEPGMVFSMESYIGEAGGRDGVKLEEQILITERGPERLSTFPFEPALLA